MPTPSEDLLRNELDNFNAAHAEDLLRLDRELGRQTGREILDSASVFRTNLARSARPGSAGADAFASRVRWALWYPPVCRFSTASRLPRAPAGNRVIHDAIMESRTSIAGGETISEPLKKSGVFPPMVADDQRG